MPKKPVAYLKNSIIYQINPRAFTNEGTINAAAKLLPHLKETGFNIVYLCPIFMQDPDENRDYWSDRSKASKLENPKNPYRISDYYSIDPEYGTLDDLKNFVREAHELGLKVILDLVYYHCGPNAVFIAEHPDWIRRLPDGTPDMGIWHFPKLNYENEGLRDYMAENMVYYVRECDVDGYRCDVGDSVPLDFWKMARERVESTCKEIIMINEGTKPEFIDVFDMNYGWFLKSVLSAALENGNTVKMLQNTILGYSKNNLQGTFNSISMLDNHDFASDEYWNRFEKRIGKDAMDACFVVNYTLPNVPCVYNGAEVCDTNRHSIWGNRFHSANLTIDWQNALTADGQSRLKLLRTLAALRHTVPALGTEGSLSFGDSGNDHVLAFTRELEGRKIAVLVNLSNEKASVHTDIDASGIEPLLMRGAAVGAADEKLSATLDGYGYVIAELA